MIDSNTDKSNKDNTNKKCQKGNKKLTVNVLRQNPFIQYFKERLEAFL